jgi:hypothetical protein
MCQTDAFLHLRLTTDSCLGDATGLGSIDRARHAGHIYSDKPPGMAVLAIPAYEAVQLPPPPTWHMFDLRLWFVRVVTAGAFFVLCAFLVGRVAEGLAPGSGAPSLVTFALGTLASSFSAENFSHVPAMALGFASFLLLWRRHSFAAGLVTGLALLVQYEEVIVLVALGAYGLWRGHATLLRYAAGVVPGAALLAAYDWAAFGAPWRNPLSYSDNIYEAEHRSGFLGIHVPNVHSTGLVFVGDRGLLVTSPVLLLAAVGLILVWRRGLRSEALVCAAITAALLIAECGYFSPYGGLSPGPRYFIPALPFLALGLGPAFGRWPRLTIAAAAASVVAQTALLLTWSIAAYYPGTIWTQIGRTVRHPTNSLLFDSITKNAMVWLGPSRLAAAMITCALAASAFVVAVAASHQR